MTGLIDPGGEETGNILSKASPGRQGGHQQRQDPEEETSLNPVGFLAVDPTSNAGTTGRRWDMPQPMPNRSPVCHPENQLMRIGMITYRKGSLLFTTPGESSSISSK